jgi:WD40 repeat protein/serine/threonine protein kinase
MALLYFDPLIYPIRAKYGKENGFTELMAEYESKVLKGYEIHQLAGEGGFGAVYRAFQPAIGRDVAIKVILPQFANQPDFIRRFESEAQLIARLEHLHIVPLFDYWREPDGAYLVMRWLKGGTLRSALEKNAWTVHATARLLNQIAGALTVAHRAGVIHRDIKPSNILLDEEGNAYLSDFGIAMDTLANSDSDQSVAKFTGSAAYVSPEQINLQPIGPFSDVYSLGIMVYEMLAGAHPYSDAKTPVAFFIKHTTVSLPPLSGFPPEIETVLQKSTAKDVTERYTTVAEFAYAFKQAVVESDAGSLRVGKSIVGTLDYTTFELTPVPISEDVANPYKGLRAFQESDAEDFFGRENLTQKILDQLQANHEFQRFLGVVGPSGSGKSSVVKAGVIPALRKGELPGSENWFIVEMVPGTQPLQELESALLRVASSPPTDLSERLRSSSRGFTEIVREILPDDNSQLLLMIDQFEEVFTLAEDDAQREHFLNTLYEAVTDPESRLRLIVTLRADFYDRPLMFPGISALMQQRTEVVVPLTASELERAITAPARRVNVFFQPGLASAVVTEVREQPGVLPMLQYALTELFERRDNNTLTHQAYKNIGGVLGALARRAQEIYQDMTPELQETTRQLFLRLVTLGEGTEDTRRRALMSELIAMAENPESMKQVIDAFSSYRLLTLDRDPVTRTPTVEVAHEALIREWGRLREWLDTSRSDVRLQRLLAVAATEWHESNQDQSFLLRGGRLLQFEEWYATSTISMTPEERRFLEASIKERERQDAIEAERQANERQLEYRARQRLRFIIVTLAVASLIGAGLIVAVFNQSQNARSEANNAQTQVAVAATARVEAQVQADIAQAQAATATVAQGRAENEANNVATARADAVQQADIAQTQAAVATVAQGRALVEADNAATARAEALLQADIAQTQAAAAELAQGRAQVEADNAATARADALQQADIAQTQAAAAELAQGRAQVEADNAATARADALQQADLAQTQAAAATVAQGRAQIEADNAATSEFEAVQQAEIAAAAQLEAQQQADASSSLALAASANQLRETNASLALALALAANNFTNPNLQAERVLIAVAFEAPRALFEGPIEGINDAAFRPLNGNIIATANENGTVSLWDVATREVIYNLELGAPVNSVAFRPDGRTLLTASDDGITTIWDVESGARLKTFTANQEPVNSADFSRDESQVVSGGDDAILRFWNVTDDAISPLSSERPTGFESPITSVAYSPAGQNILVTSDDGLQMWNLEARRFFDFPNAPTRIQRAIFSPDGREILISGDPARGVPEIWDVERRNLLHQLPPHSGPVTALAFSPDGRFALTGGADFAVILSDAQTGLELRRLYAHTTRITSVGFSQPDGDQIISTSADGVMYLWDIAPESQIVKYSQPSTQREAISSVSFSPDGTSLLSTTVNGTIRLINVQDRTAQEELTVNAPPGLPAFAIFSPQYTLENPIVLWGARDLHLVSLEDGKVLQSFFSAKNRPWVEDAVFSADGQMIVWGGGYSLNGDNAGLLDLWDIQSGVLLREFAGHEAEAVTAVALSPDGTMLASGGELGKMYLWDMATGEKIGEFEGHGDKINDLRFSADGKYILSGSNDAAVILWLVETRQPFRRLTGHGNAVNGVAFSPNDSSIVVSAGQDGRVILWDIESGQELRSFDGHDGTPITSLDFSPDGRYTLSGDTSGDVIRWQIDTTESLIAWAQENRYIPELTCEQRAQYQVTPLCETASVEAAPSSTPTPTPTPTP